MELYLRNCCKAAKAAATAKAATNSTKNEKEKWTLYQPSFDFNLTDPYCRLLETSYKSLHDPHLRAYYKRKDILRRLRKGGFITSNNKVICSLRELNKYRQYLTSLKIDFERNYIKEQKIIKKQVNKLYEDKRACEGCAAACFQEWLLQGDMKMTAAQEKLIKRRHLDMINRELDKIEDTTERRSIVQVREEERQHQDHLRRKLDLCRQIEEKWKTRELLLLNKIGEEVKREEKIEERNKKIRDEINKKKRALLEKKIAYHFQKMLLNDCKKEESENTFENEEHNKTGSIQQSQSNSKICVKKTFTLSLHQQDEQNNATEQKKDKETTKTSYSLHDKGTQTISVHTPVVSAKTSVPRQSLPDTSKQEVTHANLNGKKNKKPSIIYESAVEIIPSHHSTNKHQNHCQDCCQEKIESRNSFQNLTKVQLLKDVHDKKDLTIQLLAHDICRRESEGKENITSDEVALQDSSEGLLEDQEEDIKPTEDKVASPKAPISEKSLKTLLSFRKYSTSTKSYETILTQLTEPETIGLKTTVSSVMTSKSFKDAESSFSHKRTQSSVEEMKSSTECKQFMHRLTSSTLSNEDDLPSFTSNDEDRSLDPSAKLTEESLAEVDLDRPSSIKFTTLFQCGSILRGAHSLDDDIAVTRANQVNHHYPAHEQIKAASGYLCQKELDSPNWLHLNMIPNSPTTHTLPETWHFQRQFRGNKEGIVNYV